MHIEEEKYMMKGTFGIMTTRRATEKNLKLQLNSKKEKEFSERHE